MTATALVPIANGSEDIESVTIIDVLRRAGVEVTVASVHADATVTAARETRITADTLITDCSDRTFDLIALPGGMPGARNLGDSAPLVGMLRAQKEAGRLYGAICAAPAVALEPNGLLEGHAATAHPGFQSKLTNQSRIGERVVVDGHCITSQGPGTALAFALTLVEHLCGRAKRDEVAAPMVLPGA
ncbi:DJ-1 family glyoxalase III [uncultured Halovibrio sp.]|uniref:DJ-1 family glyoxalase III n=1 Tax=uncultured Halovibrio sp. TaxID=985049 RepID=UPI002600031C|nr:DJ-1 family glyoxalase III [uncultured Halovibrio sp.]